VLQTCVLYTHYIALVKRQNIRPDMRILSLFEKRTISTLKLDDLPLSMTLIKVVEKLVTFHSECTRFSFNHAGLTDDAMHTLSNMLQHRESIQGISLSNNSLTSAGVETLLEGVHLVPLQEFVVDHNQIDDAGLKAICAALQDSFDMKRLVLSHNRIGGAALAELVFLLKDHEGISSVELDHNCIRDEDTKLLTSLLSFSTAVKSVRLAYNNIGDDGVVTICEALAENSTIRELDLSGNHFTARGLNAIQALLKRNPALSVAYLSDNRGIISDDVPLTATEGVTISDLDLHRI